MKYCDKGEPPESFVLWLCREREHAGIEPSFDSLQNPEKREIIGKMFREQGFLCAYCGRSLEDVPRNFHIDHFWPQAHFDGVHGPDRRLDYQNFFLSCGASFSSLKKDVLPRTCGEAKDNWYDEEFSIIPSEFGCESRFCYTGEGEVIRKRETDIAAENMIEILLLNDPGLAYDRKRIILEIELDMRVADAAGQSFGAILARWQARDADGRLSSFTQVACRYIEEEGAVLGQLGEVQGQH